MRSLNNAANPVPVEIPAYMVEMIAKWRRTASQLEGEQGRVPTAEEIARAMGITRHKVELVARAARAFTVPSETETEADWSISDLVADEVSQPDVRVLLPDGSISDLVADEESRSPADVLLENRRTEAVMKHLNAIDGRAATILRLRFGTDGSKPMTLKDIGKQIGLTRERIRQIESDALKCINKAIRNQEGQM
jgi:RNA polymerase primary sigma factor